MIDSKYLTYFSIILLTCVSFLLSFTTFQYSLNPKNNTKTVIDSSSGESVSMQAINDSSVKNPHVPYFVGFDVLKKYGVSNDDYDYITDFLADFTVNEKHISHAKISYVKDSYEQKIVSGLDNNYQFKISINNSHIYTMQVTSNFTIYEIHLTLSENAEKIHEKSLDINPVLY